ncbi:hypothetical protein, partial [Streptococcus pneumoniae]|uniref:hypothetical protein n=1 Tax=Streptococcus pneumoniae TaxID=1313 RepID=UPI0019537BEA
MALKVQNGTLAQQYLQISSRNYTLIKAQDYITRRLHSIPSDSKVEYPPQAPEPRGSGWSTLLLLT